MLGKLDILLPELNFLMVETMISKESSLCDTVNFMEQHG
jgi:hypothetical protein